MCRTNQRKLNLLSVCMSLERIVFCVVVPAGGPARARCTAPPLEDAPEQRCERDRRRNGVRRIHQVYRIRYSVHPIHQVFCIRYSVNPIHQVFGMRYSVHLIHQVFRIRYSIQRYIRYNSLLCIRYSVHPIIPYIRYSACTGIRYFVPWIHQVFCIQYLVFCTADTSGVL